MYFNNKLQMVYIEYQFNDKILDQTKSAFSQKQGGGWRA